MGFKLVAAQAARAAWDKKGEEIVLYDTTKVSILAEYALVVGATSPAHLEALAHEVTKLMQSAGVELLHRDGRHSPDWRVLDYGGLLVHLLRDAAREFYALDKLYDGCPKRPWKPRAKPHPALHAHAHAG